MREIINHIFQIYCQQELEDFKKNKLFFRLEEIQKNNSRVNMKCYFSNGQTNKNSLNQYLCVDVLDENNQIIDICDDVCFSIATTLISIDRKERIKFYSWENIDFIEDIDLIIKYLENL